jgi:hypothetical protein
MADSAGAVHDVIDSTCSGLTRGSGWTFQLLIFQNFPKARGLCKFVGTEDWSFPGYTVQLDT